jgi:RNA polymerase sigma factor (sigma-70 family)
MSEAEFTKAFLALQPRLLAYCKRLAPGEAAEDLLQDANLRIWQKKELYLEGNLWGWMKVLTRNVFFNQQEVEQRMKFTEMAFLNGNSKGDTNNPYSFDGLAGGEDEHQHMKYFSTGPNQEDLWLENKIMEAIASLPSHTALLIQKRLQGMDYKQIAKALGIKPNNAKQRHFNDTKILRKLLLDLGLVD